MKKVGTEASPYCDKIPTKSPYGFGLKQLGLGQTPAPLDGTKSQLDPKVAPLLHEIEKKGTLKNGDLKTHLDPNGDLGAVVLRSGLGFLFLSDGHIDNISLFTSFDN